MRAASRYRRIRFATQATARGWTPLLSRHGAAIGAVEALNGQNSIEENRRAEDAALKLGLTAVGGSDAHFATAKWFMTVATEFERDVKTVEQMCAEIRAGRARPYVFPDPLD